MHEGWHGVTFAFGGQRSGAQTISWSRRMYARRFISGGQAQRVAKALRNRSAFRHVMHKRSTTIT
jgi:hypothetical protein